MATSKTDKVQSDATSGDKRRRTNTNNTKRQIDFPGSLYNEIRLLNITMEETHGKLPISDTILLIAAAGVEAFKQNPRAVMDVPKTE